MIRERFQEKTSKERRKSRGGETFSSSPRMLHFSEGEMGACLSTKGY